MFTWRWVRWHVLCVKTAGLFWINFIAGEQGVFVFLLQVQSCDWAWWQRPAQKVKACNAPILQVVPGARRRPRDVRKCCSHVLDWSSCLWLVSDLWPGPEPASRGWFSRAPLITECKTTIRSCDRSAWCKEIFKRALLTCLSGCQSSSSQTWSLCS